MKNSTRRLRSIFVANPVTMEMILYMCCYIILGKNAFQDEAKSHSKNIKPVASSIVKLRLAKDFSQSGGLLKKLKFLIERC